jgi:serine/threonine protein kinase
VAVTTDILPSRYRAPERIGHGGMGDIYRATDTMLGRDVAIKVLADRYAADASIRERFTREALAAARFSGEPNMVTIFDVGEHDGRPYIVMEYLGGGSLDTVLRQGGPPPPEQAFTWLEQAGRALDVAHREGIVHRDVKPANLMLDREGNVHVADFGIASATDLDSLTITGTVLGTAGYLSPEQAQGNRATPASDRYGLGVVAFELLTGTRPFAADSPTAEAAAHVNTPVPSISAFRGLPWELDPVFDRALAKDPARRYETCADFVAALRAAFADAAGLTGELPVVPVPGGRIRHVEGQRSRGVWPLLTALLLLGALAGGLLAYFLTRDDGSTASPPTTVITQVRTVTTQGQTKTVERPVTVTNAPATTAAPPSTAAPPRSSNSSSSPDVAGFNKMRQGDYTGALPLLEQAQQRLQGSGSLSEAYNEYNLAYTRFQLGRCDGVLALLDRSESIQGHRTDIDRLRAQAERRC